MSDLLHTAVAGDFVPGNSLNLAVMVVVSQHWWVTVHLAVILTS